MVYYTIGNLTDSAKVTIEFLEANGDLVRKYSNTSKEKDEKIEVEEGNNLMVWNMRYPNAERFDGMIMWAAGVTGPRAVPGMYTVKLTVDGKSQEQTFEILADPRSESSQAQLQEQFDFLIAVRDKVSETHQTIKDIRDVKEQIKTLSGRLEKEEHKDLIEEAKRITKALTGVEEALYQTKNQSRQDPLNFPIRLNNKLAHLSSVAGRGDYPPTDQAVAVRDELTRQIDEQLEVFRSIMESDIPAFNRMVSEKGVTAITTKAAEPIN